jgi:hypothetical protein
MPNYRAMAATAARKYGVPVDVFLRQINQESGFRPGAKSSAGALGIAQFMPSTAREYGVNPLNPASALDGAARYDKKLMDKYGSVARALSAYNSGRPDAYQDPNFAHGQTYNYVKSILGGKDIPVGGGKGGGPSSSSGGSVQLGGDFSKLVAATLLNAASNGGQMTPGSLMGLVMARQQYGAANSVYGSHSAPNGTQPTGDTSGTGISFQGSTTGEKDSFLKSLATAAKAVGATKIKISSGYRSPAHNAAVGGVPHSNHTTGDAMDGYAYVPGKGWVPLGVALQGVAAKYGLRSGNVPGFFHGGVDPVHVDDGANVR